MRLSKSWVIATKDFKVFLKKKNIVYSTLVVPLIVTFLFPLVIEYINRRGGNAVSPAELTILLSSFTFFYLNIAGLIPTTIASYSLVGEKIEKSLEPLLATPITDGEILLGKGISAVIPPMAAILGGGALFMVLMDAVTFDKLGYYFFPNWNAGIVLFLMVPLAAILSVEWNVIVSARVSDVRVAQQIGMLMILPFAGIYVGGEINLIDLGVTNNLLLITGAIVLLDLLLLYVAKATFQREEILTKWR